jgi:CheY-like chemotaxis protein
MVEHVFDMFAQAERSSDRSQGGLGIGLALVKNLVTLHRGQVAVFSEGIGKGSRFTITLPRAAAPAGAIASPLDEMGPAEAHGLRLLVVDDNEDAGEMLGLYLETAGYQVTVAQSAQAALAAAEAEAPDVCLLDIGLPDMDGNELARRLRRLPQTASATLVAITGYGQEADRARAAGARGDPHLLQRRLAVDDDFRTVVDEFDLQHVTAALAFDIDHVLFEQAVEGLFDLVQGGLGEVQKFGFGHATLQGLLIKP